MTNRFTNLALAAAMAIPGIAEAGTMEFSYATPGEDYSVYGYNMRERYDVAIRIGEDMAGAKVKGFTVPLPVTDAQVAELKGWLSSELKILYGDNFADITTVDGSLADKTLTVDFGEGVTIPAEGIYVGYSFDIISLENTTGGGYNPKLPIACVPGDNRNGFWLHTSTIVANWRNMVDAFKYVSPMVVTLEGDFYDNGASASLESKPFVEKGQEGKVAVTVCNHGKTDIRDIHYTYDADGVTGDDTYTFATPIDDEFGSTGTATITIPPFENFGTYPLTITIDRVNGQENLDKSRTVTTDFVVAPFIPLNRPLVEEYTGLWCGGCPAGYVALEELSEKLGKDFVAISYHEGDMMEIMNQWDFPIAQFTNELSYPSSQINRLNNEYPDKETLEKNLKKYSAMYTPANIEVQADWTDDTHSAIKATATVRFIESMDSHNYRIAFALVADNLSNPRFIQKNYYVGNQSLTGKWWDIFTKGEAEVKGLVFNSILAATSDTNGVPNTIPETITMSEAYSSDFTFKIDEVRNTGGAEFLNSDCKLRVIAYIVDTNNKSVLNSNSSSALSGYTTGVGSIEAENDADCEYYNLQGVRVENPSDGIFIKVAKTNDGQTVSKKVRF